MSKGKTGDRPRHILDREKIRRLRKNAGHTIHRVRRNQVTFKSKAAMIEALSFLNMLRIIGTISVSALRGKLKPHIVATRVSLRDSRSLHQVTMYVQEDAITLRINYEEPTNAPMIATVGDLSFKGDGEVYIPRAVISAFPDGALIRLQRIIGG